jgi:hypothetical protein
MARHMPGPRCWPSGEAWEEDSGLAYQKCMQQQQGGVSHELRRLVAVHRAATARLAAAQLRVRRARLEGLQRIASHLQELHAQADAW